MRRDNRKSYLKGEGALVILSVMGGLLLWALLSGQDKTKASQLVKAAQGGQVRSPSGQAVLSIPAGALAADTKITVAELPAMEGPSLGPVYDLQPDGLKFLKPAAFTVKYSPQEVAKEFEPEDVVLVVLTATGQTVPTADQQGQPEQPMIGWDFLETEVDTAAGSARAQLTHLSRYGLRACASWRIGDEEKNEIRGKFDFGMKSAQKEGAGSATANYNLVGELLARAEVPIGKEGMAMAHSDLTKWFRVKRGKNGQRSISNATISVSFRSKATLGPGTNQYNMSIVVQCYDAKPVPVGIPYIENVQLSPNQGRLVMPGLFQQNFFDDPQFGGKMTNFPLGPRHQNIFPIVRFKNCRLEAGKYYGLTFGGTISVAGFEPDHAAGIPARGGRVEWEIPLGFFISRIRVTAQ